ETSAAPAKLVIESDRNEIAANGEDAAILKISALDSAGRMVPIADNDVTFEVSGGQILGVGNGNPSSHERDRFFPGYSDIATSNWRMIMPSPHEEAAVAAPPYDDSQWKPTVVYDEGYQISKPGDTAAFRGSFELAALPAGTSATLYIGRIDDEGTVYLNGKKLGETDRWDKAYAYDSS